VTAVAAPRPRPHLRRRWPWLAALALAVLPALLISPLLACGDTAYRREAPADGAHVLCLCRVPLPFVMPGQGSDAGGYAVLRDRDGWIEGVVAIEMVGAVTFAAEWSHARVAIPLALELPLPAPDRPLPQRALIDASWRVRAAFGLIPHDTEFR
jgi:hypothetical protein